ncbi:MAG: helix-turn-helix domain-containing protein [Clostridia bacterium]|nr:helix-turn-helix domain-containing protein [Clostridia bacterium]
MNYLSQNLKILRMKNNFTQEDVADYLNITPQSVSKWERGETYPDITLLPALANLFETSIDLLMGMDTIRAEKTIYNIHNMAHNEMKECEYEKAEKIYRDALVSYPNNGEMFYGISCALALQKKYNKAIFYIEKGLKISTNRKQVSTMYALLCYLYLVINDFDKALCLAKNLPHSRESREVVLPFILSNADDSEIFKQVKALILG